MKGKTLILVNSRWPVHKYMVRNLRMDNVVLANIYRSESHDIKYIAAALWLERLKLPFQSLWYGSWKYDLKQYDLVIVFYHLLNTNIISYIKEKNPDARIILYFWDTITSHKYAIPQEYKDICEFWSYDISDCNKYGLKFNNQFYFPKFPSEELNIKYDAFLCLRDKGRMKDILHIKDLFSEAGMKVKLCIVRDRKSSGKYKEYFSKQLDYDDLLNYIYESRCLIEITKAGQHGITLRSLEALFYDKKLITNNGDIVDEDFYRPENIFIISNETTSADIHEFMSIPTVIVDGKIKEKYLMETWINRFTE